MNLLMQSRRATTPMPAPRMNEEERLAALHRLQILDTPSEPAFERLVQLTQSYFRVPIAAISLMDEDRQWFKAICGLSVDSTPRDQAFCNYTILHDSVLVIQDARTHSLFAANPLVTGSPHLRFYAGAPLVVAPGIRIGSLCIIDTEPRDFSPDNMRHLAGLAHLVVGELWLRDLLQGGAGQNEVLRGVQPETRFDFSERSLLTASQVRAARGLLDWSIGQLADASDVSPNTIKRLEKDGNQNVRFHTIEAVKGALIKNGVIFTGHEADSVGVILRRK